MATIIELKKNYPAGTRFNIQLVNEKSAYVYAIGLGNNGKAYPIYPSKTSQSALLNYDNSSLTLPDKNQYLQLEASKGRDYICLFFSKEPLNIYKICSDVSRGSGSFFHRANLALKGKLIATRNMSYLPSQIGFFRYE